MSGRLLLKRIAGALCLVAGILLGFLPFVPGVLLILFGLELLGLPLVPWEKVKEFSFRRRNKKDDQISTEEHIL